MNSEPVSATAVSVTSVPWSNSAAQVIPQLTPAGLLAIEPVPVPANSTVTVLGTPILTRYPSLFPFQRTSAGACRRRRHVPVGITGVIRRAGVADHVGVTPGIGGNGPADVISLTAEVGGIAQRVAVSADARHEGIQCATIALVELPEVASPEVDDVWPVTCTLPAPSNVSP